MLSTILWIISFVGVAFIYASAPVAKLFTKNAPSPVVINIFKAAGTLMCIAGMAFLYLTGNLI